MHGGRARLRCVILGVTAAVLVAICAPASAQTASRGGVLSDALAAGREGDWSRAERIAAEMGETISVDIVLWSRLREGLGDWDAYAGFLARHPDWPNDATLRMRAESLIPRDLDAGAVIAFFGETKPRTGTGSLRLADAYAAEGQPVRARAEILRGWLEASFTRFELDTTRARYEAMLAPHHEARLDTLLWQGRTGEAEAMLTLVDADMAALARARIAVRRDTEGLTLFIRAVPADLRGDPGLAFERYLYRITKGRRDEAEEYLLAHSTSAEVLGRPEFWMDERAALARQSLRRGDANAAYRLAAQNFGVQSAAFAEAEWLAGYVAMTELKDPALAAGHFEKFRDAVSTPISVGRAGYWLGLARELAGDAQGAREAYALGALHQTSFYGQLAAERAGIATDPDLSGTQPETSWRRLPSMRRTIVKAAQWLHLAGEDALFTQFLRTAAEEQPAMDRAGLAKMAHALGRAHIGIRIAKDAARAGIILPEHYYPLHEIAEHRWAVPAEFALAVARQESEMNPAALSPAGARGLMQLMPATAEQMAGQAGIPFDAQKLVRDPLYNARLGTEYLARMVRQYAGSYVLATAAYNAGPGRVNAWIETYGDPRAPEVDMVTWIETIPFEETRNYVMRVLEGLHVYRARLKGQPVPIRLVADINAKARNTN